MRLFVALELPEEARQAIAERVAAERDRFPAASWVRAPQLHLTLLFLGEIDDAALGETVAALSGAELPAPTSPVSVGAAGAFPERGPLRVIWLGLEPAGELARLAEALRFAATGARLPFDARPFHSHVTLARCRTPWPPALRGELAGLEPELRPCFVPASASLISSVPGPSGPSYTTVAELPLREAA